MHKSKLDLLDLGVVCFFFFLTEVLKQLALRFEIKFIKKKILFPLRQNYLRKSDKLKTNNFKNNLKVLKQLAL